MTKISKILTAAVALGVMGVAILPAASYAATDALVQVTISATDSDNGGNNATGYKWFISDRDGGTTNMTTTAGSNGGSTGGFAMINTKVPISTGITAVNSYGFKAYYSNASLASGTIVTGILNTDNQSSEVLSTNYYGKDLLVGSGATAATAVTNVSTPVAVGTDKAGTLSVTVPALNASNGNQAGGANSWFKYDTTLANGTYENTLTVTTIKNS